MFQALGVRVQTSNYGWWHPPTPDRISAIPSWNRCGQEQADRIVFAFGAGQPLLQFGATIPLTPLEMQMKRRVHCIAGLVAVASLMVACGSDSATDTVAGALGESVPGAECADANLERNLTPEEFARESVERQYELHEDDPQGLGDRSTRDQNEATALAVYGDLVRATPTDGQAKYAAEACTQVSQFYERPADRVASVLEYGYMMCAEAQLAVEISSASPIQTEEASPSSPSLESTIYLAEIAYGETAMNEVEDAGLGEAHAAAFKFLCPQVPQNSTKKQTKSADVREFCAESVSGPDGRDGRVLVAMGDANCQEAIGVINNAFDQVKHEADSIFVAEKGVVQYSCGAPTTSAASKESAWDYKCESPMGDKVIVWNVMDL